MKTLASVKQMEPHSRRSSLPVVGRSSADRREEVRRILYGPRLVRSSVNQTRGVVQRSVKIEEPYQIKRDFAPAQRMKAKRRGLGRANPILNSAPMAPALQADKFENALKLPTLAERDLRRIRRPNLRDPLLDMVRADLIHVEPGQKSERVGLVQEALIAWAQGLDMPDSMKREIRADRFFGEETLAAVKRFQTAKSLTADGTVGRRTLAALEMAMAQLDGSIFHVARVAENHFAGTLHTPPFPPWANLVTTQDFLDDFMFRSRREKRSHNRTQLLAALMRCTTENKVWVSFAGNAGMVGKIERHEKQHESDQKKTIRHRLVPWDLALETHRKSRKSFRASSRQEAEKQIFATPGLRTPADLSQDIVEEWIADNKRFHSVSGGAKSMTLGRVSCVERPVKKARAEFRIR